jgi:hypothetical protein
MHRSLKGSLKCLGKEWLTALPGVLLGLRTAPRDDTGTSCAELVFGCTLRLPGEFITNSIEIEDTSQYVQKLRKCLRKIRSAPFVHKTKQKIFVPRDLWTCKRVYLRVDRVKLGLEQPYDGPFTVLKRSKKFFTLDLNGRTDTVCIDRLKPAYEMEVDVSNEKVTEGKIKPILTSPPTIDFPNPYDSPIADKKKRKQKKVQFSLPVRTSSGRRINPPARYCN